MRMKKEEYYQRIVTAVDRYKDENGTAPTVYELERILDIPRATVSRYLQRMREEGVISYAGRRSLMTAADKDRNSPSSRVPILGAIACGIPKFAEENIEDYVRLPEKLFGKGDFFLLRADGESMINAGIAHGDLVLIRRQSDAEPGQIVVALIDEETATLKRYAPNAVTKCIDLIPENPDFPVQTIDPKEHSFCIQGVAVKVIRDLG